jgi:triphosphoribosyl-dephospho-CoA synthase
LFQEDPISGYAPATRGDLVRKSILLEASAVKAGNVHPNASFPDMSYRHFVQAAECIGHAVDQCAMGSVGETILRSCQQMMQSVGVNTSLGTILLLAPLAKSAEPRLSPQSLHEVLQSLDASDTIHIYQAIRISHPGGIGTADQHDLADTPPESILDAMRIASTWDDVALQYTNDFEQVFAFADRLRAWVDGGMRFEDAIRRLQIEVLVDRVDSLISRKLGRDAAEQVRVGASRVIAAGEYGSIEYEAAWKQFDDSLRDPNHRKNPGTIADLIAAAIFVMLATRHDTLQPTENPRSVFIVDSQFARCQTRARPGASAGIPDRARGGWSGRSRFVGHTLLDGFRMSIYLFDVRFVALHSGRADTTRHATQTDSTSSRDMAPTGATSRLGQALQRFEFLRNRQCTRLRQDRDRAIVSRF